MLDGNSYISSGVYKTALVKLRRRERGSLASRRLDLLPVGSETTPKLPNYTTQHRWKKGEGEDKERGRGFEGDVGEVGEVGEEPGVFFGCYVWVY